MGIGPGEGNAFDPTANSVVNDMIARSVGMDNPMTAEAIEAARVEVQARLDRAQAVLDGAPIPAEGYDSEAMAALVLLQDEQRDLEAEAAKRDEVRSGLSDAALAHMDFLSTELQGTENSFFFNIHFPAPEGVTPEELEVMASDLREQGWNAKVAPLDESDEEAPIGIRIVDEDR